MNEQSIIVIGENNVGKTTMIYRYLEKDENTIKPTIAIDYSFARKTGKNWTKNYIHFWEIGNLTPSLIAAAISGALSLHSAEQILLIIMIDLSKPETLWSTLERSLTTIRSAIKITHSENTINELKKSRLKKLKNPTNNSQIVDPLPYKTCIVAGKYDQFKNFKLATKKLIGQTLRQISFTTLSHLQYYSSKDSHLVRKMKDILSHYVSSSNENNYKKEYSCDYEQPLLIPIDSESLNDIHLNNYSSTQSSSIIDVIKHIYLSEYPDNEKLINEINFENPTNDPNFNEPIIDKLLSQREEEISINLQEMIEGNLPKPIINDPH
ncbi:hypothetical protein PV328_011435 [Microctonus aethiopoides]|uniref:Cytoplasmic dynein 2 light intermediate chain 1 n=1 Tax=Microctonus aethiopoides TaxID=144406 RepID=A0AA39C4I3_9HYME|nr:hypothetical protein PV328_011435 [Microctonus aethiopoides]